MLKNILMYMNIFLYILYIHLILIHRFHTCNFAYSLKCIHNPKINNHSVFTVIQGHVHPTHTCPSQNRNDIPPSHFSRHTANKYSLWQSV